MTPPPLLPSLPGRIRLVGDILQRIIISNIYQWAPGIRLRPVQRGDRRKNTRESRRLRGYCIIITITLCARRKIHSVTFPWSLPSLKEKNSFKKIALKKISCGVIRGGLHRALHVPRLRTNRKKKNSTDIVTIVENNNNNSPYRTLLCFSIRFRENILSEY